MPFQIIRNDITKVKADAIVNTANPHPKIGSGTDSAIYKAAGEEQLLAERMKIGDIPVGQAAVTSAFHLDAKYIIHTVGPVWVDGTRGEEQALSSCYTESLKLAESLSCESIAFPLISTGVYGFPQDLAIRTATSVIYDFLMDSDMMVYLVVFGKKAFSLSGKLFQDIKEYIDDDYAEEAVAEEYGASVDGKISPVEEVRRRLRRAERDLRLAEPSWKATKEKELAEHLKDTGESFRDHLMKLIIERDMKNSDVYHGANISKQHFSKIISNRDYQPKKNTVCALAIALHLDLQEANALLEKAGYTLSKSSRFDKAVEYFLLHKMYNIVEDNFYMDDNDLDNLGTQQIL